MRLYLVRHAHAGQRLPGGRDIYRPLSPQGRDRAIALAELLGGAGVDRLLASPATRCQQTLEALARSTGLEIEEHPALWEGSSTVETMEALGSIEGERIVACSHGDVIPAVIEHLAMLGVPVDGRGCELGSIWVVERVRDRACWTGARYVGRRAAALE